LEKFGKIGISAGLFRKAKNTYERTINCIQTNKGCSAWFETRSSVREGSVLSLIFFNIILNDFCNKTREKLKITD
jgi:hypothetical protein